MAGIHHLFQGEGHQSTLSALPTMYLYKLGQNPAMVLKIMYRNEATPTGSAPEPICPLPSVGGGGGGEYGPSRPDFTVSNFIGKFIALRRVKHWS